MRKQYMPRCFIVELRQNCKTQSEKTCPKCIIIIIPAIKLDFLAKSAKKPLHSQKAGLNKPDTDTYIRSGTACRL